VLLTSQHCTVIAAANPSALRQQYGHWTAAVRRSQTGLVLARSDRMDGELLGAVLPRDLPVAPRPGLAWMVQQAVPTLVQVAIPTTTGHQRPRLTLA
jgi:DNA segregation ATPase FtsK/SpoIIIE, S-DNA-T family